MSFQHSSHKNYIAQFKIVNKSGRKIAYSANQETAQTIAKQGRNRIVLQWNHLKNRYI